MRRAGRSQDLRRLLWHVRRGGLGQARRHLTRRRLDAARLEGSVHLGPDGLEVPPWPLPERAPRRPDLRVGVVLDDFSTLAYRYEWDQVA